MICSNSPVTIDYNNIEPSSTQISDPLASTEAPPSPLNLSTNVACPGDAGPTVYNNISGVLSGTQSLSPGIYPNPVELTGSATFADCAGPDGGYPGIYVFTQGLWINPQSSGDTVTGSNVVIATGGQGGTPYPLAGNVPGSVNSSGAFTASGTGNGAPCLPAGTKTSTASGWGNNIDETSLVCIGGVRGDQLDRVRRPRLPRLAGFEHSGLLDDRHGQQLLPHDRRRGGHLGDPERCHLRSLRRSGGHARPGAVPGPHPRGQLRVQRRDR